MHKRPRPASFQTCSFTPCYTPFSAPSPSARKNASSEILQQGMKSKTAQQLHHPKYKVKGTCTGTDRT
eukprot:5425680-Amphidinium_carterae.1